MAVSTTSTSSTRSSNIELLRIICMFCLVLVHYLARDGIVESFDGFNLNSNVGYLVWATAYPCVVAFVLISGYFLFYTPFHAKRIVNCILQAEVYSILGFIVSLLVGMSFSMSDFWGAVFPVFFHARYWFIGEYIGAILVYRFLFDYLDSISKARYQLVLGILMTITTIIPTVSRFTMFGKAQGLMTFIGIFAVGGYLRKYDVIEKVKMSYAMIIFVALLLCSYLLYPVGHFIGFNLYNTFVVGPNNIFAMGCGVSLFIIFAKIRIPFSKVINYISSLMLGVYLTHENYSLRMWIWNDLVKKHDYFEAPFVRFIANFLVSTVLIFLISFLISIPLQFLIKQIEKLKIISKLNQTLDKWFYHFYNQ